jgi:hypothetical protein
MEVECEVEKTYSIKSLTEKEASLLRTMMQNPLTEDEPKEVEVLRVSIFKKLIYPDKKTVK